MSPNDAFPSRLKDALAPTIARLHPYQPGKPAEELRRELGLGRIVKLASNENPLGPGRLAREAYLAAADRLALYPDGAAFELKQALAQHLAGIRIAAEQIVLGAGSDEVIAMVGALFLRPGTSAAFGAPAFAMYKVGTLARGADPIEVPHRGYRLDLEAVARAARPETRVIFLDNPNNPLGTVFSESELIALLERVGPERIVLVDEAYAEYAEAPFTTALPLIARFPNLVVTRTFSKAYGLAGLRVGYGVAHRELADFLNRIRQPFNVGVPAQAAAAAALGDGDHLSRTVATNRQGKRLLEEGLGALGLPFVPTHANFLLIEVGDGDAVFQALLREGVIARSMKGLGLPAHLRVSIGTAEEIGIFLAALRKVRGR